MKQHIVPKFYRRATFWFGILFTLSMIDLIPGIWDSIPLFSLRWFGGIIEGLIGIDLIYRGLFKEKI